jgi:hypothetical protein
MVLHVAPLIDECDLTEVGAVVPNSRSSVTGPALALPVTVALSIA